MADNTTVKKQNPGQLNSVQLNIVTVVDVQKAVERESLKDCIFMMDNSVGGTGQGTARLQTVCKQGQVINFIIYAMDPEKRPDGTWPPMPKINNIVFLDVERGDEDDVAEVKIMTEFKIYGGPDKIYDLYTPVYYYWAGTVLSNLSPGIYPYRFVIELEQEGKKEKMYLNTVERPSLKVIDVTS
ncbi:MAG: hypothetical protein EWV52_09040 [Microcystis panniformis Mp_MB_F_20051200_S6D]|nr:MAG: hypothetical protein EWV87_13215 [Microcystis panniformis Mp_GB_SS_20050300_S99]TRV50408.1 MAG: hypothetical protein EWV42_11540 [Microcystis panniformis Mp_GB_SS_20050300_S99D]TRV50756.1 MAG: hypothetical protein EWV43_05540 [Microcystis panniformis Mp_MB_F_20080800_S26D]TRV62124.1 MAG: hypothetical protein EWV69_06380 [Microcystis panniformis Mp_MB_F_20080800_S26]TRV63270.1 MAG: hypothetical protein EWV86_12435 [Microcystis panniformis Mp_MB_F_20051200_S9D]TRV70603.1 MAG: hypothetica